MQVNTSIECARIFISYARNDRIYCDHLLEHIGWLRHSNRLDVFDDSQIKPGTEWNAAILANLKQANLVICLVSPAFVNSRYCTINEMAFALDNNIPILPVIIRAVDFESLPISKFQALPLDASRRLLPIAEWDDKGGLDRAWMQVAQEIRLMLPRLSSARILSDNNYAFEPDVENHNVRVVPELEHINWKIDSSYKRLEETIGRTLFATYIPNIAFDIPIIKVEIEKSVLPLKEYAIREQETQKFKDEISFVYSAFEVTYVGNRIISIRGYARMFFGGAHSNYEYMSINLDLLSKRTVSLGDLLNIRKYYRQIVAKIEQEITIARKANAGNIENGQENSRLPSRPDDLCVCLVGQNAQTYPQSLRIMFAPYEIGAFAEGSYEINIDAISLVEFGTHLFREVCGLPVEDIVGSYVRPNDFAPATIWIKLERAPSIYRVIGEAYWGTSRLYGPNMGQLDFTAEIKDQCLYSSDSRYGNDHTILIRTENSSIQVEEYYGSHGMNVDFTGKYFRDLVEERESNLLNDIELNADGKSTAELRASRAILHTIRKWLNLVKF